jgi:predicted transcriptional regulator
MITSRFSRRVDPVRSVSEISSKLVRLSVPSVAQGNVCSDFVGVAIDLAEISRPHPCPAVLHVGRSEVAFIPF